VGAVAAVVVLARRGAPLGAGLVHPAVRRAVAAGLLAALAMALAYNAVTWTQGAGLVARLVLAMVGGGVVYLLSVVLGHRRRFLERRRPEEPRAEGATWPR
jgi:hypothetical protein